MYVLDWCDVCTGLVCSMYWTGVLYVLDGVMYVLDWCDVCTGPPHINSMDLNSRLCIW